MLTSLAAGIFPFFERFDYALEGKKLQYFNICLYIRLESENRTIPRRVSYLKISWIIFKCKEKKRDMYVLQIFRISFEASVYEEEFIDLGD